MRHASLTTAFRHALAAYRVRPVSHRKDRPPAREPAETQVCLVGVISQVAVAADPIAVVSVLAVVVPWGKHGGLTLGSGPAGYDEVGRHRGEVGTCPLTAGWSQTATCT